MMQGVTPGIRRVENFNLAFLRGVHTRLEKIVLNNIGMIN